MKTLKSEEKKTAHKIGAQLNVFVLASLTYERIHELYWIQINKCDRAKAYVSGVVLCGFYSVSGQGLTKQKWKKRTTFQAKNFPNYVYNRWLEYYFHEEKNKQNKIGTKTTSSILLHPILGWCHIYTQRTIVSSVKYKKKIEFMNESWSFRLEFICYCDRCSLGIKWF